MPPSTFTSRTIVCADDGSEPRLETAAFELIPALDQGRAICNLFAEFLGGAPPEFREKLPFLNKLDIEMEWAAASGGAAFFALFHQGQPVEMGVLATGANAESDEQILAALQESVAVPMLGERARQWMALADRPFAFRLRMPGNPELGPTLDLLTTALASVYFRAIIALAAETAAAASEGPVQ